jgi:hypothetical protein
MRRCRSTLTIIRQFADALKADWMGSRFDSKSDPEVPKDGSSLPAAH